MCGLGLVILQLSCSSSFLLVFGCCDWSFLRVSHETPPGRISALLPIPSQASLLLGQKPDLWLGLSCQLMPPATANCTKQHMSGARASVYSMGTSKKKRFQPPRCATTAERVGKIITARVRLSFCFFYYKIFKRKKKIKRDSWPYWQERRHDHV